MEGVFLMIIPSMAESEANLEDTSQEGDSEEHKPDKMDELRRQ